MANGSRSVILVVEDEVLIRLNAVAFVQKAGFETIDAANADDAVLILESRVDIRIIFTDVDMPGSMNGMELVAAVRSRWPPIELIITSGKPEPRAADIPARGLFFSKPYSEEAIMNAIRSFAVAAAPMTN